MKYKRIIKIILNLILILATSSIVGMVVNSTCENVYIRKEINSFKGKGIFQESLSNDTEKFYKVSRETWMSARDSFVNTSGKITYGGPGDIVVGMNVNYTDMPIVKETLGFMFGGHSSFVCYDEMYEGVEYNPTKSIESLPSDGVSLANNDFWNNLDYQTEVVGIRVKCSEEKNKKAFHYMADRIGKKYSYSFLFGSKNKYYCTDLITRAYDSVGININYDGFYVSVQDLVCSSMTYISFYKTTKKGINYYYYLG